MECTWPCGMHAEGRYACPPGQLPSSGPPWPTIMPSLPLHVCAHRHRPAGPHCGRRFNQKAAERHIPSCANTMAKPKFLKAGSEWGGDVGLFLRCCAAAGLGGGRGGGGVKSCIAVLAFHGCAACILTTAAPCRFCAHVPDSPFPPCLYSLAYLAAGGSGQGAPASKQLPRY